MEVEFVVFWVVSENFNIVVEEVPRHIRGIQALSPNMELWRPEVHSEGLFLAHTLDNVAVRHVSDLVSIDRHSDVVRGPFKRVGVPLITRVKPMNVLVCLSLVVALAAKDYICGERTV